MSKINVGLLSFGMSGRLFHAPFITVSQHLNLYATWERSKNIAENIYPGIKTFRSLDDLLADELVELVVVNTPNFSHYEYAKKALQAGKHVIVEKPFTITVEEGNELIEIAAKQNKKLSVYQNRRYDSDYKTVKKIISEGWLGKLVEVEVHFDRYKENPGLKIHKETPGPGTGTLYDLGAHVIDQALQLFGMPQKLFADIQIMRPVSRVDDYFELILYYDILRVRLRSTYVARETVPGYVLHGYKGSFLKPKTDVQEAMLEAGEIPGKDGWGIEPISERGLLHTEKDGKIIKEYVDSLRGDYGEYYEAIYQSIQNNKPLPVTAGEGLAVIRIIESAYLSNETQSVVEF